MIASGPKPNGDNFKSGLQQVADVVATPDSQEFSAATLSVTLATSTTGADIYYTTDGSIPTMQSTKYTGAISLTGTTTLNAIAVKVGMIPSNLLTATYTKTTT